MTPTPLDVLRAFLAGVISRADNAKVPDGYANDVGANDQFVSDWSVHIADRVLEALWDGGIEPGEITERLGFGPSVTSGNLVPRKS